MTAATPDLPSETGWKEKKPSERRLVAALLWNDRSRRPGSDAPRGGLPEEAHHHVGLHHDVDIHLRSFFFSVEWAIRFTSSSTRIVHIKQ